MASEQISNGCGIIPLTLSGGSTLQ